MPFRPAHSLLRVEVPALTDIDTSSVESLFGMWSLFSKTSHAMEDGKRLENLSWRLWNRETFCCDPRQQARSTLAPRYAFAQARTSPTDIPMPTLSSSLHSTSSTDDDDDEELDLAARSYLRRCDSTTSTSRGREKHITPVDLQNIVISIKETSLLEPADLALPTVMPTLTTSTTADLASAVASQAMSQLTLQPVEETPQPESDADKTPNQSNSKATLLESSSSTVNTAEQPSPTDSFASSETSATEMSTHSIIRGFVPGGAPSSYRSQTNLAAQPTPILRTSTQTQYTSLQQPKKKGKMFTIGTSSGEDESSLETHMHRSSLSNSLRRSPARKMTSFKEEVTIARPAEHCAVMETDDEDEEVSESAIEDDDDSSDWEDSDDQSGPSSMNERDLFQRVDSRPNLTSRRSLLTTLMHEPDRARALANAASRSTPAIRRSRACSPNGPSLAASPDHGTTMAMPPQGHPKARPIIMTTSNTHPTQLALSPRTTRRNMLSDELTESLRKHLLWERQHRSIGNFTALKRRHTSHDVKNLKQHPEPAPVLYHKNGNTFTNEYFHAGLQEYHAKGW